MLAVLRMLRLWQQRAMVRPGADIRARALSKPQCLYSHALTFTCRRFHSVTGNDSCTFRTNAANDEAADGEPRWFSCDTCDISGSRAVCSSCAERCHRGHVLTASRRAIRGPCLCGAEGLCFALERSARRMAGAGTLTCSHFFGGTGISVIDCRFAVDLSRVRSVSGDAITCLLGHVFAESPVGVAAVPWLWDQEHCSPVTALYESGAVVGFDGAVVGPFHAGARTTVPMTSGTFRWTVRCRTQSDGRVRASGTCSADRVVFPRLCVDSDAGDRRRW